MAPVLAIFGCVEDPLENSNGVETDSMSALIETQSIEAGEGCTNGGFVLKAGTDFNMNGVLEEDEVTTVNYLCNGENGSTSSKLLTVQVEEPNGNNCPNGGINVLFGLDLNSDEQLEESEVQSSFFICHGTEGTDGQNGTDGKDGTDGQDGTDGSNGSDGEDGMDGQDGVDGINGSDGQDGVNGADGFTSLSKISIEEPGDNCYTGGLELQAGLDTNGNFQLEDEEVEFTYYICNGANGADGQDGTDGEDGQNGVDGQDGINGEDGLDGQDGTDGLDGSNGFNTLTILTNEASGDNCSNGGLKIEIGLDTNSNGSLDQDEIIDTQFICNGQNGSDGTNGSDGLDGNAGQDGVTSLIRTSSESAGANCSTGGVKVETGLDYSFDGFLDDDEIMETTYICNGETAQSEYFEFYFSNELEGYAGTTDVTLVEGENDGFNEEVLGVGLEYDWDIMDYISSNSLVRFADLETISTDIGSGSFEIVEAILYLRVEVPARDGGEDGALGVKTLVENAPLFDENLAHWKGPDDMDEWFDPGTATSPSSAYDYSDMFFFPNSSQYEYKGMVPLLMNRSQVKTWIDSPEDNKGLVLTSVSDSKEFEMTIFSSEHDEISYRPMLFIKVKKVSEGGRRLVKSDERYKDEWNTRSYDEKMKPFYSKK